MYQQVLTEPPWIDCVVRGEARVCGSAEEQLTEAQTEAVAAPQEGHCEACAWPSRASA
jgi:hypothetical protein